jgi:uncharacterized membrane protein YheB (UPF0754 family)
MSRDILNLITIPLFSGITGYIINWTGVWMLFKPVRFAGFRLPGLQPVSRALPRKIQQVPGVMHGALGWQGIIPSRAAKMGSIAVDKGIAKLGSASEFYEHLEPDRIAEHVLESSRGDIRELVERVMQREHPGLWGDLTPELRESVHDRVQQQLPDVVRLVIDQIGDNIDQLLDVKLMVIRHMEAHPELANKVFGSVGERELRFIIRFGFVFGFLAGIPVAVLTILVPYWFVLPVLGVIVGWVTNWLAIVLIFEPVEERGFGPFRYRGLFLRRQQEVAGVYGEVIAEDIVNLRNIGEELLDGARSDRTRHMISTALRPTLDRAAGLAAPAVRVAVGTREYDAIRDSMAVEGVDYTMTPLTDPEFNRQQSDAVRRLISDRMKEMSPADFTDTLRSAIRQDEWLLLAHGGVLGLGGGLLHLLIFG